MDKPKNPNSVRFINKQRNKVQFFSKHLVHDARFKKMTGYEPQPLPTDPIQELTKPSINIEDEVQKRVAEELAKYQSLTGDIGQNVSRETKPKRKYTKKKA